MKIKDNNSDIKVENVDVAPKVEPQKYQPLPTSREPTKKEVYEKFNNDPNTKSLGAIVISKRTYMLLWIAFVLVILLLTANIIWSNINVSAGKMKGDVNIDIPERAVNVTIIDQDKTYQNYTTSINNNITINVDIGDNIADKIASDVLDIIEAVTNSS